MKKKQTKPKHKPKSGEFAKPFRCEIHLVEYFEANVQSYPPQMMPKPAITRTNTLICTLPN